MVLSRQSQLDMSNVVLWDNPLFFSPQVVQSGGKNIELAIIRRNQPLKVITHSIILTI
jgi:hypothetical protein